MSSYTVERRNPGSHWWLVLIQGIAAIILGIFLLTQPLATIQSIVLFLGFYWLFSGIFTLISLLWNREQWGLKVFTGIVGILAGLFIVNNPIVSAFIVPASFAWVLGFIGIVMGIGQIVQALRGGGWGMGILGVLSVILGFLLMTNPAIGGLSLAFMLGVLLIIGGFLAIFAAFQLRGLSKTYEEAQLKASRTASDIGSTAVDVGNRTATAVGATAAGATAAGATAAANRVATDVDHGLSRAGNVAGDIARDAGQAVGDATRSAASAVGSTVDAAVDATLAAGDSVVDSIDATFTGNVDPFDAQEMSKYRHSLEFIEGVGPEVAAKLKAIGIANCLDLIKQGSTAKGRAAIAQQSGIPGKSILEWVNHVDLYRIKGVGSDYASLLEASGVDTVVELAQRNPANLSERLNAVNVERQLVQRLPTQAQVQDWIAQAKDLPRVITY